MNSNVELPFLSILEIENRNKNIKKVITLNREFFEIRSFPKVKVDYDGVLSVEDLKNLINLYLEEFVVSDTGSKDRKINSGTEMVKKYFENKNSNDKRSDMIIYFLIKFLVSDNIDEKFDFIREEKLTGKNIYLDEREKYLNKMKNKLDLFYIENNNFYFPYFSFVNPLHLVSNNIFETNLPKFVNENNIETFRKNSFLRFFVKMLSSELVYNLEPDLLQIYVKALKTVKNKSYSKLGFNEIDNMFSICFDLFVENEEKNQVIKQILSYPEIEKNIQNFYPKKFFSHDILSDLDKLRTIISSDNSDNKLKL